MTLIGDVGGFNSAIILLPSFIMTFYSNRKYNESIQKEIPIRSRKRDPKSGLLHEKIESGVPIDSLSAIDLAEIFRHI